MCQDLQVPLLGRVPLDPRIGERFPLLVCARAGGLEVPCPAQVQARGPRSLRPRLL